MSKMKIADVNYAPIIIPVYDRLEHLRDCINALLINRISAESALYIVSDAAYREDHNERIAQVRDYIRTISGFKEVKYFFRDKNLGAHESITSAIRDVLKAADRFIFLEDDIIVSSDFLQYMNDGLAYYQEDKNVFSICGFKIPFILSKKYDNDIYFYPCNSPWGFASWRDRWNSVNLDYYNRYLELKKDAKKYKDFMSIGFYIKGILQADSWKEINATDLRVYYHMFQHNMCSVFPVVSKTQNWGFDGTGEHCGNKKVWWAKPELDRRNQSTKFIPFTGCDKELLENHRKFQDKINGGILAKYLKYTWFHRLWKKVKSIL